jgi:hypothetical protein
MITCIEGVQNYVRTCHLQVVKIAWVLENCLGTCHLQGVQKTQVSIL